MKKTINIITKEQLLKELENIPDNAMVFVESPGSDYYEDEDDTGDLCIYQHPQEEIELPKGANIFISEKEVGSKPRYSTFSHHEMNWQPFSKTEKTKHIKAILLRS